MKHIRVNKMYLLNEYIDKQKTLEEIANESGCPKTTLCSRLKKYGIKPRRAVSRYWDESSGRNLTGEKFGKWKVLSKVESKNGKSCWDVECECGCQSTVTGTALRLGHSKGCNKCKYRYGVRHANWKGHGEISNTHWKRILRNAKRENKQLSVEVTVGDVWELFLLQNRTCVLSGLSLTFGSYYKDETTASLDRIDSNKGYVKGNVQWIHKTINKMKQNLTDREFISFCRSVANHQEKKDGADVK